MVTPPVCIVGAGPSGIATAKELQERGIDFDWFEEADRPGGVWATDASTARSGAYRHLHTNTSKTRITFRGFPHLPEVAEYPHHTEIRAYLERYLRYHALEDRVTYRCPVVAARPIKDYWEVELGTGETRVYRHLAVATGHLWERV